MLSIFYLQVHDVLLNKEADDKTKDENRYDIHGLTVYKDDIYYSESRGYAIKRCNKNNCTNPITLRNNTSE